MSIGTLNRVLSQQQLTELAKYDTPTICNAIELFDVRPRNAGYMDQRIQCCFEHFPPMVGYATTATFGSDAPADGPSTYDRLNEQIETLAQLQAPPVMVFQDLDDPPVAATFGEVMCATYQAFGAVGIVTSGGGRDLDQVEALKFPAFIGSTLCAHAYTQIRAIDVAVRVGGMTVRPGDLLHGDRNGITTIPNEIASEVAEAAAGLVAAEGSVLNYLKQGSCTPSGYRQAMEESKRQMNNLAVRYRLKR